MHEKRHPPGKLTNHVPAIQTHTGTPCPFNQTLQVKGGGRHGNCAATGVLGGRWRGVGGAAGTIDDRKHTHTHTHTCGRACDVAVTGPCLSPSARPPRGLLPASASAIILLPRGPLGASTAQTTRDFSRDPQWRPPIRQPRTPACQAPPGDTAGGPEMDLGAFVTLSPAAPRRSAENNHSVCPGRPLNR